MIPCEEDGKRYQKWSIGELNIQTCSDDIKLDVALQECHRANLDVVCFQEVKRIETDSLFHRGYDFYWCGQERFKRNGVAIAVRKCKYIKIDSVHSVNPRLMAMDITVQGFKCGLYLAMHLLKQMHSPQKKPSTKS